MRYTRIALLLFGAGLVLGFVVVVDDLHVLDRAVSALMALALIALPVTVIADWRRTAKALRAAQAPRAARKSVSRPAKKPRARGSSAAPAKSKAAVAKPKPAPAKPRVRKRAIPPEPS